MPRWVGGNERAVNPHDGLHLEELVIVVEDLRAIDRERRVRVVVLAVTVDKDHVRQRDHGRPRRGVLRDGGLQRAVEVVERLLRRRSRAAGASIPR